MCIIIEKRDTDSISKKWMRAFFASNKDGWGIMYQPHAGGEVLVRKGFGFDPLWTEYVKIDKARNSAVIHLRMATHGAIEDAMTHPFEVVRGVYLMHNGIIDAPDCDAKFSDTWSLVRNVIRPLLVDSSNPAAMLRNPGFRYLLESHMGGDNRIVMMDEQGHVTFNDKRWHTLRTGMRVSNTYAWRDPETLPKSNPQKLAYGLTSASLAKPSALRISWEDQQDDLDEQAVDEYMQRHAGEFDQSMSPDNEAYNAWIESICTDLSKSGMEHIRDFCYTEPEDAASVIEFLLN